MFKDRLKDCRKELGLTQEEFSKKLGISRSYLGDLERGRLKGNNINIISKVSDITGKPMEYFLDKDSDDIEIKPYDFLDAALNMLIDKNMIDKNGKILSDKAKKIIDDMLEKEILLKLESKGK